ncbi:DUF5719 family protein [Tessaracoccus caeni]|uniref:DUF5719 family protein n=1 Tax=Tessaracoccus caeni TaxID=3031239 RepID=UPI0023DCCE9A|nr:DUF5719 family protein [Tessaracoccus caeni]MDF1488920.1 DUF5719 family protein [Tessaracoccus caeni]
MLRRILEVAGGLVGIVAITVAATQLEPMPLPRLTDVEPPREQRLVCMPPASGTLYAQAEERLTLATMDGEAAEREATTVEDVGSQPFTLRGVQPAGGVRVDDAFVGCQLPAASGILQVADASVSELLIINPDATDAAVDLSLYGPDGEVLALGSRGIVVSPQRSRTIALSVLAGQEGPIGVGFSTSRGRVAVVAVTEDGAATTPTSAADRHLIPGIAKNVPAQLILSNPGTERATAEVYVLGANARFQPSGGAGLSIPAGASHAVDLTLGLAGELGAIEVLSDREIGATVIGGTSGAMNPARPGQRLRAFGPGGGALQLSNPSEESVSLVVSVATDGGAAADTTVVVPAGTTVAATLPDSGESLVTVASPAPVLGALVYPSNGTVAVIPLNADLSEDAEPIRAELAPTLR